MRVYDVVPFAVKRDHFCFGMTSFEKAHSHINATNTIVTGLFYHVAATFDGQWMRLYVNGVEHSATNHPYPVDYGPRPMFFGTSGEEWDGHFAGTLDEVALYAGALSAAEVEALFKAEDQGKTQNTGHQ